jgi:hypothetical protein
VLMALAHGFLLLKQTAKARNQLKVGGAAAHRTGPRLRCCCSPQGVSLLAVAEAVVCWACCPDCSVCPSCRMCRRTRTSLRGPGWLWLTYTLQGASLTWHR